MKPLHLLTTGAAASAMLVFAPAEADAQRRAGVTGIPVSPPGHYGGRHGGKFRGHHFSNFVIYEREVVRVVEVEVPVPVPVAAPAPEPPPPPRKPFVIGSTYASLPAGCMKLIEDGASYYYCSGEWYRQVGAGWPASYKAVARP
jgi:hypothetical protein